MADLMAKRLTIVPSTLLVAANARIVHDDAATPMSAAEPAA